MYKCGDRIVCPPHGAALVEDIQEKWILGQKKQYLIIKPFYGQMTIMIPVDNASTIGIRNVTSSKAIDDVIDVLGGTESDLPSNWNHRFKENWRKISSGDIMQVAEVVRDLSSIEKRKSLSTKEKDLLRQARRILISEIIFSRDLKESEAIKTIEAAL